jgi:hypothetical protein
VILSLWLARRDKKIRLEVTAGHRIIVTPGATGPFPEYLAIHIVNIGHRETQITDIGWKVGVFKKRYAVQTFEHGGLTSQLPIWLKDGAKAQYLIPLNKETNWLEKFGIDMLRPFPRIQVHFCSAQVFTSIGETFEARIEKGLRKKLLAAIKANEPL